MGEASRRKKAMLKAPDVLGDIRRLSTLERQVYLDVVFKRAQAAAANMAKGDALLQAYSALLRFIVNPLNPYFGGCHDTSAVLYMRLKQLGLEPKLCLGEVHYGQHKFDHSWVELDGKVFDVAICAPSQNRQGEPGGCFAGGPIFADIDLGTNGQAVAKFGAPSDLPLDKAAQNALNTTLLEFFIVQQFHGMLTIPKVIDVVYGGEGVKGLELLMQYRDVKREWRNSAQNPLGL